jgi:transcriptional regulator with XRE-family HTH domain
MAMDAAKRARLDAAGFQVGSVEEFLGLTPEESALIEIRLALSAALRQRRQTHSLSQTALARRLQSSQSRVAKMEKGDPSVSLDLLIQALLAMGTTNKELAGMIAAMPAPHPRKPRRRGYVKGSETAKAAQTTGKAGHGG